MDNQISTRSFIRGSTRGSRSSGFSLLELMVTMVVFLVIAGAAFSLVIAHMPLFTSQQNQASLNFGLRNAAAQLQIDGANAGSNFYSSPDMPGWPLGVTIEPGSASDCYDATTHTYGDGCFDRLNIIKFDPNTPPAVVEKGGNNTATSSILSIEAPPSDPTMDMNALASHFKEGDQILVLSNDGTKMATAILTKDGQAAGNKVQLQHNPTGAKGKKNSSDNDDYAISTHDSNKLEEQFSAGDWVLKLSPAVYAVDATDPTNPKLARLQPTDPDCKPTAVAPYNSKCIIAEQIIGFKVGAVLNDSTKCGDLGFCYDPSLFDVADSETGYDGSLGYDWTQVRAIRINLIGRTVPNTGPKSYHNTFDNGPYKIEAMSVMINPRSLSGVGAQDVENTVGSN